MAKAHLYETDEPMFCRRDVTTLCGEVVRAAVTVMMWDTTPMGEPMVLAAESGRVCRQCVKAGFSDKRYIYGVTAAGSDE